MIEMIEGAPENVIAFKAVGELEAHDYKTVLKPAIDEAIDSGEKVRCVYVMGPEFAGFSAGAAWEDAEMGMAHVTRWHRCAVVTDTEWVRHLVKAFGWMMVGHLKLFSVAELPAAMQWASED